MSLPPLKHLALVGAGGALGTTARASLALALPTGWVSIPTLIANVVGAFLLGVLYTSVSADRVGVRLGLGTGVLGGFTTYSALAVLTAEHGLSGMAYCLVALALGLAACGAGVALGGLLARQP